MMYEQDQHSDIEVQIKLIYLHFMAARTYSIIINGKNKRHEHVYLGSCGTKRCITFMRVQKEGLVYVQLCVKLPANV